MYRRLGLAWVLVLLLGVAAPAGAQHEVDEAEASLWVQRLHVIVRNGQMNRRLFSDRWFVHEAIADFELSPDASAEYYEFDLGEALVPVIARAIQGDGSYTFLRFLVEDGHTVALFRLITDGGVNYHAWYLRQDRAGRVTGWDIEVYLMGERFSQAMRRAWFPLLALADPDFEDHVGRLDWLYYEHFDAIDALDDAHDANRHQQVVTRYESLPAALREHHVPMNAAILAYGWMGRAERCTELLERYRELYPTRSDLQLSFIYVLAAIDDYDGAYALIDALDERLGGDAYLNIARSELAMQRDDYAGAQGYLDAGLDDVVLDGRAGWFKLAWQSVEYALAAEDWPRVSAMLTRLEEQGLTINDLNDYELYAGYVASGAYEQWLGGREPGEAWGPWGNPRPEKPEKLWGGWVE